jgi:hypothetical protein
LSTTTTVKVLYSAVSQPSFRRRSMMGTITPRRLTTPLMNSGRIGDARGLLVGADLLHAQDVDAVLLGAQAEGEELPALVGGGGGCGRRAGIGHRACGFVAGYLAGFVDHLHGASLQR